jgi:hypothetical protein
MTVMQAAFIFAVARWCESADESSSIRVPAGAMASRDELAKVICTILQTVNWIR